MINFKTRKGIIFYLVIALSVVVLEASLPSDYRILTGVSRAEYKENPKKDTAWMESVRRGDKALREASLNEAIKYYRESLEHRFSPRVASNLAHTYLLQSRKLDSLAREAEQEGGFSEAQGYRERADSAREYVLAVTEMIPSSTSLPYVTGLILRYEVGERSVEAEIIDRIGRLGTSPETARLLIGLGKATANRKYLLQALGMMPLQELFSSIYSSNSDWYGVAAIGFYELGEIDGSIASFQKAISFAQIAGNLVIEYRSAYRAYELSGNSLYLKQAVKTVTTYRERKLSYESLVNFRYEIEPIYRSYIGELLEQGKDREALELADHLLIAEVESRLAVDCVYNPSDFIPGIAIRYIVLNEATYIFVLKNGEIQSKSSINISRSELERELNQFRFNLISEGAEYYYDSGDRLYRLLIAPVEEEIRQYKHLTIVADSTLRSIPFSSLYDGRFFLVERFAITNSLQIRISSRDLKIDTRGIFFGLSVSIRNLASLPNVRREAVQGLFSRRYLDADVTLENFVTALSKREEVSILHLASHINFSSLERSWILFHDQKILAQQFEDFLNGTNIDLLVLAACDAAVGDRVAALGLASLAMRTSADRVLGTLWAYQDAETADVMIVFYDFLQKGSPPNVALQEAQKFAIDKKYHPSAWASLILID